VRVFGQKLLIVLFSLAAGLMGKAQTVKEKVKVAPRAGVIDVGGFLNQQPKIRAQIEQKIAKLKQEHGFKLYLVIEPLLIGVTVPQHANQLRQQWAPDSDGIVVVYESSSRQLAIGFDLLNTQNINAPVNGQIPSHKASAIMNRALNSQDIKTSPDVYLEGLMIFLCTEIDGHFLSLHMKSTPERTIKITSVIIGTIIILGLAILITWVIIRLTDTSAVQKYRFSSIDCDERLAAPCGTSVTTLRVSKHSEKNNSSFIRA
jgi:hypothetical protein